mmetsp:Transcript_95671/g.180125  ORF Transcript_95671/g.180125 Transcript_95671/m.180125 type:complete len:97 (+) Transcript_95671:1871-2161(+)
MQVTAVKAFASLGWHIQGLQTFLLKCSVHLAANTRLRHEALQVLHVTTRPSSLTRNLCTEAGYQQVSTSRLLKRRLVYRFQTLYHHSLNVQGHCLN